MASKGYPGEFETGHTIRGLDRVDKNDLMVFHAGTKLSSSNELVTNGGRVLGVTSLGNTLEEAIDRSYRNAEKIDWGGGQQQYRRDIAAKSQSQVKSV
jgi:phosphoribosylamine--glycine ligase